MTIFAQCSLLGPSSTALNFHSNWGMLTVAKCEVIWHSIWKKALCLCFMLYHCDQQWCRHHLGTESYSRLGLFTRCSHVFKVVYYLSWKFRSTIWSKLVVELVDLHPFQHHFLSFISSEKVVWFQSLVPFRHWREPRHPCLCWLAVRARSGGHHNSLWRPLCGDQYDQARH